MDYSLRKIENLNFENSIKQIIESGVSETDIHKQFEIYRKGLPFINLVRPATLGDGIYALNENDYSGYLSLHEEAAYNGRLIKFVPASGAATRMFKDLQTMLQYSGNIDLNILKGKAANGDTAAKSTLTFIESLKTFAFFDDLNKILLKKDPNIRFDIEKVDLKNLIGSVIGEEGLNYASLPKGSIKFHKYLNSTRTAFEEHIVEAAEHIKDCKNKIRIHFTISPEHLKDVKALIEDLRETYRKEKVEFRITFSTQKKSTNTIAVTLDNKAFLTSDKKVVFRPAGHGALLENLNDLRGDIVYIKNIDNVCHDDFKSGTYFYKKLLAGYLIKVQKELFEHLRKLENSELTQEQLKTIIQFAVNVLNISVSDDFYKRNIPTQREYLLTRLNRPLRVCGMVKNEGMSGGGPHWVSCQNGETCLQIVEEPQIDKNNNQQKNIFKRATHFNPVDIVCGLRDYKGNNFDLLKYRDMTTGFITVKTKGGKELKALELPGLWNGSMAFWNTIFVDVPKLTFNPVKEINDLLKSEHQPMEIKEKK